MRILVALALTVAISVPSWAAFQKGVICLEKNDFECAAAEFLPEAEKGNTLAQYFLGLMYLNRYLEPPKKTSALNWMVRAAEGGQVLAQAELARMYRDGDGVETDLDEMARWYEQAAGNGDVGAQLMIADHYARGLGGHQDYVDSYFWYSVAMNYWGEHAEIARKRIEGKLSADDIEQASKMSDVWLKEHGRSVFGSK